MPSYITKALEIALKNIDINPNKMKISITTNRTSVFIEFKPTVDMFGGWKKITINKLTNKVTKVEADQ